MPKVARISAVSEPTASSVQSEGHPLIVVALFSGIGLLVSLIAMLIGVSIAWY
jgi:hypothetical protein